MTSQDSPPSVKELDEPRLEALIETVGYGIQSVEPKPKDVETRYKSTSRIVEVNGNIADGGNVHTLNNPSAVGGQGGSCFGDSGGPLFVNNTNEVVAVVPLLSAVNAPATPVPPVTPVVASVTTPRGWPVPVPVMA